VASIRSPAPGMSVVGLFNCLTVANRGVALRLHYGLWLSLVERFVRDEEAAGSNPASPMFHIGLAG
jgi:hypothetical protein